MGVERETSSSGVVWEDPPPPHAGDSGPLAAALRARPGEWAVVYPAAKSQAAAPAIRRGMGSWAPAGSFEAISRSNEDGTFRVYARFVGESA